MASSGKETPEGDSMLLIGLPEGTPQIQYTDMNQLYNSVERRAAACCSDDTLSPFIVVRDIPRAILQDLDDKYPDKPPKVSGDIPGNIIVVEVMAKPPHETAAWALTGYIDHEVINMDLHEDIIITGASRVENEDKSFVKGPDGSFTLWHHHWPILAIEAGPSETEARLVIDARRWLEARGSETETVITVKVDREHPHISFKRWQHSEPQRVTRSTQQPAKVVEQVDVSYHNSVTNATGEMVISFRAIAGREPQSSKEKNIVITKSICENIARRVWVAQEFL
ncbi:TPA_exp: Uncharacterized protein A8136_1626 [Trichophyton benhamiae CBS 112371]|uniref:Uncharacterized protein n=1 Tax=Arthroderma benhamiae (strain ATCC MYA-4681 / CBS 112371) TaxID=663331 RepID=D4AWS6_ARTBC|nr:uncharacterized protein ARB_00642 [Trichophyton benhamiae CBS 112371]EFE32457.1 hypothetical protein ARB_00642 [Trichophyton benhamiae CBS 112371]DAA75552.1 TPA_exp: Uncharacterized protein A8136_1626 [Trichophyton benhamiae CBS 112371]